MMAERMIRANGAVLCTESAGDPADPPVVLVMGMSASMLWWEDGFCRLLAERGRFVIRYDHRDTGRSATCPPGRPDYTGSDLVADAAAVIDAYGLGPAHVVGVSMGGVLAQLLTLDFADRVASLVLISTSPALPTSPPLPGPTDDFGRFVASAEVDWSDAASVIEHLVSYSRVLAGTERRFDAAAARALVRRDVERARDFRAARNHELLPDDGGSYRSMSAIAAPTLVIHGTADPMYPPEHGEALAGAIPGATLRLLEGAGHGIDRADWPAVVDAIAEHTGAARLPQSPA